MKFHKQTSKRNPGNLGFHQTGSPWPKHLPRQCVSRI